ncbi:hypothetical protein [Streptomyces galbus]|uniref:Integral membrane protein n=1 Tax=Streptomyces galbus TaxID=33898 RepID=A0ABX1IBR1_STRGB|nr:hypothetical protein [Streptomyces galbus]NKQ23116.1 hypothetical protein [Streptomyces galbus]
MDTAVLVVVAVVVVLAGSLLTLTTEPPFPLVLAVVVASFPLGTALLALEPLCGHGLAGQWCVRLGLIGLGAGVVSLAVGRRTGRGPVAPRRRPPAPSGTPSAGRGGPGGGRRSWGSP